MTSKKRKYGNLSERPLPTEDESLVDDVFAAFTRRPAPETTIDQRTIAPPTVEPQAIVPLTKAPETVELSNESTVAAPTIAQYAIVPGQYTPVPNGIFDRVIPTLHVYDQSILLRLFRLSRGHHSETCKVGYATLAKACNISIRQAQRSVERLIQAGWVERVGVEQGGSKKYERGSIYKLNLPAATIARPATVDRGAIVPDAAYKENIKKKEIKTCPRCEALKGFFYPEGPEKGIAKCKHNAPA